VTNLAPVFWIPTAFVLGIGVGVLLMIARQHFIATDDDRTAEIPPPLDPKEYARTIERIQEGYLASMSEYDRLVPWTSAGALVLSMSFVGSFAQVAPPSTKWILALAWFLLTCALLSSILAHYVSTRIKVWSERYVKARQGRPDPKKNKAAHNDWRNATLRLDKRKRQYQTLTRLLNVLAAVFLVTGLFTLGIFAVLAVPFGTQANTTWTRSDAA